MIPLDPQDLDRIPPEDLDVCSRCSGTGGLPSPDGDPQNDVDCPVCGGDGILPELGGAA